MSLLPAVLEPDAVSQPPVQWASGWPGAFQPDDAVGFSPDNFTPMEALCLFHEIPTHGLDRASFERISLSIRQHHFVRADPRYDPARLGPGALRELFRHLWRELSHIPADEGDGALSPQDHRSVSKAAPLPTMYAIRAELVDKLPDFIHRLYCRYHREVIESVMQDNSRLAELEAEIAAEADEDAAVGEADAPAGPATDADADAVTPEPTPLSLPTGVLASRPPLSSLSTTVVAAIAVVTVSSPAAPILDTPTVDAETLPGMDPVPEHQSAASPALTNLSARLQAEQQSPAIPPVMEPPQPPPPIITNPLTSARSPASDSETDTSSLPHPTHRSPIIPSGLPSALDQAIPPTIPSPAFVKPKSPRPEATPPARTQLAGQEQQATPPTTLTLVKPDEPAQRTLAPRSPPSPPSPAQAASDPVSVAATSPPGADDVFHPAVSLTHSSDGQPLAVRSMPPSLPSDSRSISSSPSGRNESEGISQPAKQLCANPTWESPILAPADPPSTPTIRVQLLGQVPHRNAGQPKASIHGPEALAPNPHLPLRPIQLPETKSARSAGTASRQPDPGSAFLHTPLSKSSSMNVTVPTTPSDAPNITTTNNHPSSFILRGSGTRWTTSSTPSTPRPVKGGEMPSPAYEPLSPVLAPAMIAVQPVRAAPLPVHPSRHSPVAPSAVLRMRTLQRLSASSLLSDSTAPDAAAAGEPADDAAIVLSAQPSSDSKPSDLAGPSSSTPRPGRGGAGKRKWHEALLESAHSSSPPMHVLWTRGFSKVCSPVLDQIASHRDASMFANPVRERDAPHYKNIVRQPLDISSIRAAIKAGNKAAHAAAAALEDGDPGTPSVRLPVSEDLVPPRGIINSSQLKRAIVHMLANAIMYNPDPARGFAFSRIGRAPPRSSLAVGTLTSGPLASGTGLGSGADDSVGYRFDEDGIVRNTRRMFVEVEKLLSNLRSAEVDAGAATRESGFFAAATPSTTDAASVGDPDDLQAAPDGGLPVKRRRVGTRG